MAKELYKIISFWNRLWSKVSWLEILIISIGIIIVMSYAKESAVYSVKCSNGSIYQLREGLNYVCGEYINLNNGKVEVLTPEQADLYNSIQKRIINEIKSVKK